MSDNSQVIECEQIATAGVHTERESANVSTYINCAPSLCLGEARLDDAEFVQAFRDGTLPSGEFNHRGHLRLSWLLLRRHGFVEGNRMVAGGIRQFAASKGAVAKYHETITQFWLRIVYHAIQTQPSIHEFNEFLSNFPFLLDTGLPSKHWRPPTIQSMDARATWVEPDLKLLPAIGV